MKLFSRISRFSDRNVWRRLSERWGAPLRANEKTRAKHIKNIPPRSSSLVLETKNRTSQFKKQKHRDSKSNLDFCPGGHPGSPTVTPNGWKTQTRGRGEQNGICWENVGKESRSESLPNSATGSRSEPDPGQRVVSSSHRPIGTFSSRRGAGSAPRTVM